MGQFGMSLARADHWDHRVDEDYYEQPGILLRKMNPEGKQRLFENTARAINGASQEVLHRHIESWRRADPAYGEGVAKAIGILQVNRCPQSEEGAISGRGRGTRSRLAHPAIDLPVAH